jgi:alkylation response protein AidB-like acyl-CoA dehydrogenase
MEPSSADRGFFQQQPVLRNQTVDDVSFRRVIKRKSMFSHNAVACVLPLRETDVEVVFLPDSLASDAASELRRLGDEVLGDQIFAWISDAERNQPFLRGGGRDAFGRPRSELVTAEGWRKLQEFGLREGMVAFNYDTDHGPFTRPLQMLRVQLWTASSANVTCPSAMHDGAARLLQLQLASSRDLDPTTRRVFQDAFDRLTSRDPTRAWTSGQWMTERSGGSDVSRTETIATLLPAPTSSSSPLLADPAADIPLGPYSISGFKWFSSAAESAMAILLARTTTPERGLSAFFAPTRRHTTTLPSATGPKPGTELNGIRIVRLKNKLGTQPLPTAELELQATRGWLVGHEGQGVRTIATMLAITRVHSAVAALGYLGRGLGVARAYARVREVGGGGGRRTRLWRSPLHMRTLAGLTGEYHGLMLLTYYTTYLLGLEERGQGTTAGSSPIAALTPPAEHVGPLLRVLSSLHKSYCCKHAVPAMFACMEALGGVGYLNNTESEHLNVSRLFRDCCVLPIWEGTTDVLATDALRALKHPTEGASCMHALDWFVGRASELMADPRMRSGPSTAAAADDFTFGGWLAVEWTALAGPGGKLRDRSLEELLPDARDVVFRIAEVLVGALLCFDARRDGAPEANVMAMRFLEKKGFGKVSRSEDERTPVDGEWELDMDCRIVYGGEMPVVDGPEVGKL